MNLWPGVMRRQDGRCCWQAGTADRPDGSPIRLDIPGPAAARLESYADRSVILGLRPENVAVAAPPPGEGAWPCGTVEHAEFAGMDSWITLRWGGNPADPSASVQAAPDGMRVVARSSGATTWLPGQKVAAHFDLSQAHFFDPDTGMRIGPD
jgi:ABC-type sugar transport system ATPase subunit